jgi:predicted DNA-binding transcriptional regulator AlpA
MQGRTTRTADERTLVLRTPKAARVVGLGAATLEKMRRRGDGPPFVRLGRKVIGYQLADLAAWVESQKVAR